MTISAQTRIHIRDIRLVLGAVMQIALAQCLIVGHKWHTCRVMREHLSQPLLLHLAQGTLGLMSLCCWRLWCCFVSSGKAPILHRRRSLRLHLERHLVETLPSSMGIDPLQGRCRQTGNLSGLESCWGGNLSAVLTLPSLEMAPMRIGQHGRQIGFLSRPIQGITRSVSGCFKHPSFRRCRCIYRPRTAIAVRLRPTEWHLGYAL